MKNQTKKWIAKYHTKLSTEYLSIEGLAGLNQLFLFFNQCSLSKLGIREGVASIYWEEK